MLKVEQISLAYGDNFALCEIDMELAQGEMLALIGPNGAGKSTLLKAINGRLSSQSGHVSYKGEDLLSLSHMDRARILSSVPQARIMGGAYTVEQTVMMGRTVHMNWLGRDSKEDREVVKWALAATKLEAFAQRRNAELSGGELQRVLLARALAQATPILLMDEPTNHLDLQHQIAFLSLVKGLTKKDNKGVLMALHDLNLVSRYADRVALIVDGKMVAVGTPNQVLQSEIISDAYQTDIEILEHPRTGAPLLYPKV